MKKLLAIFAMALIMAAVIPAVLANVVGTGIGTDITTEKFVPRVWMCDHRVVLDDNVEPGRFIGNRWYESVSSYNLNGSILNERMNNYAFEGEKLVWDVLVFDKNGVEKIKDVFATIGNVQGAGNDIEANCILDKIVSDKTEIPASCNARIDEQELKTIPDNTAAFYKCILTVETPQSMYGEYWVTVEADDLDDNKGIMDEKEFWFFNPVIALSVDGSMKFTDVRPGTQAYSDTILVGNDADQGSGVLLDMFISGTDFYDSASSGAKCPFTNQLALTNFRYFATSGAYSTQNDQGNGRATGAGSRNKDAEGYVNIGYGDGFNKPYPFYDGYEILQGAPANPMGYYPGNTLTPGAEIALTFKLSMPEPCNGNFDTGQVFFWGEAI